MKDFRTVTEKKYILKMAIPNYLGISYRAYVILTAIANYSENELCQGRAAMYIADLMSKEKKEAIKYGEGGFMTACLNGDLNKALILADNHNRKAIAIALYNDELNF